MSAIFSNTVAHYSSEPAMMECKSFFSCSESARQTSHGEGAKPGGLCRRRETHHGYIRATEDFLASEVSRLTVQERSEALNDVHCVGENLQETPELIQKSLAEFGRVLHDDEMHPIYEMATKQNRAYVEDPAFILIFLRANRHDVLKSVRQMIACLQQKALYFGNDKVARDITLDDLTNEDKHFLLSGLYHIQEGSDRTGRVVVYIFNACPWKMHGCIFGKNRCTAASLNRMLYYLAYNILIPIPAVQMKGLVVVYYDVAEELEEEFCMPELNFLKKVMDFVSVIPVRYSAMHNCLRRRKGNLAQLNGLILRMQLRSCPLYSRVRSRIHIGNDMELQNQLQSHGIPIDKCPIDRDGKVRNNTLHDCFYKHHSKEGLGPFLALSEFSEEHKIPVPQSEDLGSRTSAIKSTTTTPLRHDILLGRGRALQNHFGNIRFRNFLKRYIDDYDLTPRKHKGIILVKVVEDLKSRGIRFLRQMETGEWIETDTADVEKLIGQFFRNLRKKRK